jgi:hypothetical protein
MHVDIGEASCCKCDSFSFLDFELDINMLLSPTVQALVRPIRS